MHKLATPTTEDPYYSKIHLSKASKTTSSNATNITSAIWHFWNVSISWLTCKLLVNFDEVDSADEETQEYLTKEIDEHDKDEKYPEGRPGTLLNRLISYGNSKTEKELAEENAGKAAGGNTATTATTGTTTTKAV